MIIKLNLDAPEAHPRKPDLTPPPSLQTVERDLARVMANVQLLLDGVRQATVFMPTETLLHAVDTLMPAERMGVLGAAGIGNRVVLGALHDVTGSASRAHVQADPRKLGRTLMNFERAGSVLAGWIHSHPGTGPLATTPSGIDRTQSAWTRDFGAQLVALIVVRDGFVRLWGDAIETGLVRVEFVGEGIQREGGHRHVFKLEV